MPGCPFKSAQLSLTALKDRLRASPGPPGRNTGHHSSSMETVSQRLYLSRCRTLWATTDPTSGGRGEQESGLREAVLGFRFAPGHLGCGSLRALLWSLCFTQVSSVPAADTSLSSRVLSLPAMPQRTRLSQPLLPTARLRLCSYPPCSPQLLVICFMGYHKAGEDLQHSAFCVARGGQSSAAQ